jgi:hypothetical protein
MEALAVDLNVYRKVLDEQFGVRNSDNYTLTHIDQLSGPAGAGVAFNLDAHVMWVLIDNQGGQHENLWRALFLAQIAAELTEFFETLVIPGETSTAPTTVWTSDVRQACTVYKFTLADRPAKLRCWP